MSRDMHNQRGMTLAEVIIVVGISGILIAVSQQAVRHQTHAFRERSSQGIAQTELRIWVGRMLRDIREAGYDPLETESFGMLEATSDTLRFTRDLNGDGTIDFGTAEEVGYRFNAADSSVDRWLGGSNWRTVIHNVDSMAFEYTDQSGAVALTVDDLRVVQVTIALTLEAASSPGSPPMRLSRQGTTEVRNALR